MAIMAMTTSNSIKVKPFLSKGCFIGGDLSNTICYFFIEPRGWQALSDRCGQRLRGAMGHLLSGNALAGTSE